MIHISIYMRYINIYRCTYTHTHIYIYIYCRECLIERGYLFYDDALCGNTRYLRSSNLLDDKFMYVFLKLLYVSLAIPSFWLIQGSHGDHALLSNVCQMSLRMDWYWTSGGGNRAKFCSLSFDRCPKEYVDIEHAGPCRTSFGDWFARSTHQRQKTRWVKNGVNC
jgi:hypothetical protein